MVPAAVTVNVYRLALRADSVPAKISVLPLVERVVVELSLKRLQPVPRRTRQAAA
jgi:hypothetical protein